MKQILLVCCLILPYFSIAQNGWYIKPSLGYCRSKITIDRSNMQANTYNLTERYSYSSGSTFMAGLSLIFQYHNLNFGTGLNYTTTKGKEEYDYYHYTGLGGATSRITSNGTLDFQHFIVPLTIGRRFQIDDNVSFIPLLGIECSYNFKKVSDITTIDDYGGYFVTSHYSNTREHTTLTGTAFTKMYYPVSLWLVVQMGIEANINKKSALTFDYGYHYMATEISKLSFTTQHGHAFFFNMGCKFRVREYTRKTVEKNDSKQKK